MGGHVEQKKRLCLAGRGHRFIPSSAFKKQGWAEEMFSEWSTCYPSVKTRVWSMTMIQCFLVRWEAEPGEPWEAHGLPSLKFCLKQSGR